MTPRIPVACSSLGKSPDDADRRLLLIATCVAGGAAALATAMPFLATFAPSERAKAAGGPVEVDISDIAPGGAKTVEWRGKPVWVVRRSPQMLAALQGHDAELVDPQSVQSQQPGYTRNAARAINPEIFVAIGICTHLGCIPNRDNVGAPGGYLCACHGSVYDASGRILSGPAPLNLPVPPYKFVSDTLISIG